MSVSSCTRLGNATDFLFLKNRSDAIGKAAPFISHRAKAGSRMHPITIYESDVSVALASAADAS